MLISQLICFLVSRAIFLPFFGGLLVFVVAPKILLDLFSAFFIKQLFYLCGGSIIPYLLPPQELVKLASLHSSIGVKRSTTLLFDSHTGPI